MFCESGDGLHASDFNFVFCERLRASPVSTAMYPPPHPAQSTNNAYQSASYNAFYPAYYNSHYMQAYSQQRVVNQNAGVGVSSSRVQGNDSGRDARSNSMPFGYQPGNSRCSHPGCTFTGSAKTVEIHMMDRHLIYPPGWDKRKKKPEWDADPSLKGCARTQVNN